jgi:hypothetical protein
MVGYTKLFSKLLTSSIWDEDDKTRLVWITMLAMCDKDGFVRSTLSSLAMFSRVSKGDAQRAVDKFLAPDPESTTKDHEGRRIEVIEGGWRLLNHEKYRNTLSAEERREYYRQKKAEYRAKEKALRDGQSARQIVKERVELREKVEKNMDKP